MSEPTVFECMEKETPLYTAIIKDDAGNAIPAANLATLKLTLYSKHSNAIVNDRNAQDALNQNGVAVDSQGLLTWQQVQADTAILDDALEIETHVALFEWTYGGGGLQAGKHEIQFRIKNLEKVA